MMLWTLVLAAAVAAAGRQVPLGHAGGQAGQEGGLAGVSGESLGSASDASGPAGVPVVAGVPVSLFSSLERYARLVDIAYCVGNTATGIAPPFRCASRCRDFPEMRLVTTWNTGVLSMRDNCGYIAVDESAREIVVAFRGTYSITNTVVDLSTIPQEYVPYEPGESVAGREEKKVLEAEDSTSQDLWSSSSSSSSEPPPPCHNCTVHSGFLASWKSARTLVLPEVAKARTSQPGPPLRVHLVGHSLGGAVAALAALEMKAVLGWDDIRVTTFGEPRVGNDGLARYVDDVLGTVDLDQQGNRKGEDKRAERGKKEKRGHGGVENKRLKRGKKEGGDDDRVKRGNKEENRAERGQGMYQRITHKNDPVPLLPLAEWGYRSHSGEIYIDKSDLPPAPKDLRVCKGPEDPDCVAGEGDGESILPPALKPWELFFAHRDYFWRLGLCVPGGDPADWGRERYNYTDL